MIRLRNKFKISALFFSVYFLFLFGGMEFMHHHSGIHENEICKVCSLSVTLSNSLVQLRNIILKNDSFEIFNPEFGITFVSPSSQYTYTGRAPPLSWNN